MKAVAVLGAHPAFALHAADLTCANMRELSVFNIRSGLHIMFHSFNAQAVPNVAGVCLSVFGMDDIARFDCSPIAGACLPTAALSTWT
jgi:hypothetical protein